MKSAKKYQIGFVLKYSLLIGLLYLSLKIGIFFESAVCFITLYLAQLFYLILKGGNLWKK